MASIYTRAVNPFPEEECEKGSAGQTSPCSVGAWAEEICSDLTEGAVPEPGLSGKSVNH